MRGDKKASPCATPRLECRVVSYNVLSENLCKKNELFKCAPTDLETNRRHGRITTKLGKEVAAGSVICLQEVTLAFGGFLIVYFERLGYNFVHDPYVTAARLERPAFRLPVRRAAAIAPDLVSGS